jgi:hypothetical protein
MKCIFNIGKKYLCIGQAFSGERCGPWVSCSMNLMSTSYLSVHMSVERLQILIIISSDIIYCVCLNESVYVTHSFIWWDSFVYQSDINFLFIRASLQRVSINFCHSFLSNYSLHMLEILAYFLLACHMVEFIIV